MAGSDLKLQMLIEAQDKTQKQLKSVLDNINNIEKGMKSLEKGSSQSMNAMVSGAKKLAGVFGVAFAANKIKDFALDSAKAFADFEQSSTALEKQFGKNAKSLIASLNEVSQGTVSNADLVMSANRAMALNVTQDVGEMSKLLEFARVRGRAMGLDTTQAFNDIVTGIGRGSQLILDNLGIITKGWAEEAKAAGVAYDAQFILNKVLEQGSEVTGKLGKSQLSNKEKMLAFSASLDNLKVTIGKNLLPVLFDLTQWATNKGIPAIVSAIEWLSDSWDKNFLMIRSISEFTAKAVVWTLDKLREAASRTAYIIDSIRQSIVSDAEVQDKMLKRAKEAAAALAPEGKENLFNAVAVSGTLKLGVPDDLTPENIGKEIDKIQSQFRGGAAKSISGNGKDAIKEAMKLQEELTGRLGDSRQAYREMVRDATKSLAELKIAHDKNTSEINKKIDDLKANLKSLTESYNETIKGLDISAAEKFVEQQQKIKDLQKEIQDTLSRGGDTSALNERLQKEQAALDKFKNDRTDLADEIAEAQRKANLTEFERFIEDLNKRREEEDKNFQTKKEQIQSEIQALEDQRNREAEIYQSKREEYLKTLDTFDEFKNGYIDGLIGMEAKTEVSVKIMENRLAHLQRLLAEIKSVESTVAQSRSSTAENAGIPRAFGGSIIPGMKYRIGERGEEDLILNQAARVEQVQNESNYSISIPININGGGSDSGKIAEMIEQRLPAMLARALQLRQSGVPSNI